MAEDIRVMEKTLYNNMLKNAFTGFFKSAGIAAALGMAAGALLFGNGLLPEAIIPASFLHVAGGGAALGGALLAAATVILPAGAFGATAGIQATRDAWRWRVSRETRVRSQTTEREGLRARAVSAPAATCNCPESHLRPEDTVQGVHLSRNAGRAERAAV